MADNYILFSEVLTDLTRREQVWLTRRLTAQGKDLAKALAAAGIQFDPAEEDWPGFDWEMLGTPPRDLWMFSRECGNVDHVTQLIRAFLHRFRPSACWTMTWAEACSTPRVGEFGGGSALVTRQKVELHNAHHWAAKRAAGFRSKASATAVKK